MNTAARPYPLCPEGSTGTYPAPKEKKAPSRQALSGKRPSGVTSIAAETGSQPSMQEVKQLVIRELATALQCEITSGS